MNQRNITMRISEAPNEVYATAWSELYKVFSEWQDQENVDLMDSVLEAVKKDYEELTNERDNISSESPS